MRGWQHFIFEAACCHQGVVIQGLPRLRHRPTDRAVLARSAAASRALSADDQPYRARPRPRVALSR